MNRQQPRRFTLKWEIARLAASLAARGGRSAREGGGDVPRTALRRTARLRHGQRHACADPATRRQADFLSSRDFLELGVDHAFVRRPRRRLALGLAAGLGLVHGLAELHRRLHQGLGLGLDRLGVLAFQRRLQLGDRRLDGRLLVGADLVAVLGQRLFGGVDQGVGVVLGLDQLLALLVLGGVGLGFLDHRARCRRRRGRRWPGCGSTAPWWSPCPWPRR